MYVTSMKEKGGHEFERIRRLYERFWRKEKEGGNDVILF